MLHPVRELDDDELDLDQVRLFVSRERRRTFTGAAGLSQTHRFEITATILAAQFAPAVASPITFTTKIRCNPAAVGSLFTFGNATNAVAAWVTGGSVFFRAGGAAGTDQALIELDFGVDFTTGHEIALVFAARPGSGMVRAWASNGVEVRDTASGGTLGATGLWAANATDGVYAAATAEPMPADVTVVGAPTNFEVIEPLAVFARQVPRHFV